MNSDMFIYPPPTLTNHYSLVTNEMSSLKTDEDASGSVVVEAFTLSEEDAL